MFSISPKEPHLEKLLQEEEAKFEALTTEYEALLDEFGLTRESLEQFLSDESLFSPEDWKTIQTLKGELETKLNRLVPIPSPSDRKKKKGIGEVQKFWIPVR